jgi:TonB family protein
MSDLRALTTDWFSVDEVARAAGVSAEQAWRSIGQGQALVLDRQVPAEDAVHLVRVLRGLDAPSSDRVPFNRVPPQSRKMTHGVFAAAAAHVIAAIVIFFPGALASNAHDAVKAPVPEVKLVYLMQLGKGGGGGGGGLREKTPPPPAKRKGRRDVAETAGESGAARAAEGGAANAGTRTAKTRSARGTNADRKTGAATATTSARGAGTREIDSGRSGGSSGTAGSAAARAKSRHRRSRRGWRGIGTGCWGRYRRRTRRGHWWWYRRRRVPAGAGIDPPTLVREVRPVYTDEARRQRIEGDVILEIVVRSDGSVGSIRVKRSLGGGLDQRAIDAVRQWRFNPARRHGTPVDVAVEVAVGFKLR